MSQLLALVFSCLCACSQEINKESICKKIGSHNFVFPRDLVAYSDTGRAARGENGILDAEQGIVLKLPEIRTINSTGTISEVVSVSIRPPEPEIVPTPPQVFLDMWFGEGEYKDRYVLFDEGVGLYRIYISSDIESMWEYFRDDPTRFEGEFPEYEAEWVASCSSVNRPLRGAVDKDVCKSSFFVDGLQIEFNSTSLALSDLANTRSKITREIWKYKVAVACDQ